MAVCFEKETICLDNLLLLTPDIVILGHLAVEEIYRFLYAIKLIYFDLPVVAITGASEVRAFIQFNGFIHTQAVSPAISPDAFKGIIDQIKAAGTRRPEADVARDWPLIVGSDPEIVKIKKAIFEIARSGEALLIRGERGTGKDLIARAVHFWSDRRSDSFVKVDSGAITREIFQNELSRWFESDRMPGGGPADATGAGTIFFDDIGQLPMDLQGALLHLFEVQEESPGNRPPGVRIIAATRDDLGALTGKGLFRKDLFYRLNVFLIEIPPLRRRLGDIAFLVDFFNDKYSLELGKGHSVLPQETKALYAAYDWPGNVREIENVVKRSVIVGDESGFIESLCRCFDHRKQKPGGTNRLLATAEINAYMADLKDMSLKEICKEFIMRAEKRMMKKALERTNWNRKKAAGLLNISYKSLLNKMKVYNLTA